MSDLHDRDDPVAALVPEHVAALVPYQSGKPIEELERELGIQGAVKLASNENPLGPSPRAVEAGRRAFADVHQYPDGGAWALRGELAARLGVDREEIVCGAGSNQIIYGLVRGFCRPGIDEVVAHRYGFITYGIAARGHGVAFIEAEVTPSLGCDVDALVAAMGPRTRLVFLANPNNPTGAHVGKRDFERLLAAIPDQALFVVDEAYREYAAALDPELPDALAYRRERPLLVSLRTFSKVYGLAGLRVGYAVADCRVIQVLDRVRGPFNVSSVAQAAARAALDDGEHVARSLANNAAGLAWLRGELDGMGLVTYPSLGNFLLLDAGRPPGPLYEALLRRGVIVRPMASFGLPRHLRISVGTPEQNARVVAALAAVLR